MKTARLILAFFGVAYCALGAWCAVATESTARSLGYEFASAAGRSEYFVVYVGLDLALGVAFLLGALRPRATEPAAFFAFSSSLFLMACRAWTSLQGWTTTSTVRALFATEIVFTVLGLWAWRASRSPASKP